MKIAIAGPDGSGKSSVCLLLNEEIENSIIVYAGKREFVCKSTKIVFKIWKKMRFIGKPIYLIGQYFLYYPFEYIENYYKFVKLNMEKILVIYDRHPIDRVAKRYELKRLYDAGLIKKSRFIIEYPMSVFWSRFYTSFFSDINMVYILLPSADECFKYANGQYKNLKEASIRIESYRDAYNMWKRKSKYFTCVETNNISIQNITDIVINNLKKENYA